jgi:dsRNA-specific ribonuclease
MNIKNLIKILVIVSIIIVQGIIGFQYSDSLFLLIPCITLLNEDNNNNNNINNNNNNNNDLELNNNTLTDISLDNSPKPNNFSDNLDSELLEKINTIVPKPELKKIKSELNNNINNSEDASNLIEFLQNKDLRKEVSSYKNFNFFYKDDREYLEKEFNRFLNELDENKQYQVLKWVDTSQYGLVSLGNQWLIDKNTNELYEIFSSDLESFKENHYNLEVGDEVLLRYRAFDKRFNLLNIYSKNLSKEKKKYLNIDKTTLKDVNINKDYLSNKYLPFSINESAYGKVLSSKGDIKFFLYNGYYIERKAIENGFEMTISTKSGTKLAKVIDLYSEMGFIRIKNKVKIYFNKKGEYLKSEILKNTTFLKPIEPEWELQENFITFDIETYIDSEGFQIPYACGWFDGKKIEMKYLTDFKSPEDMIINSIKGLIKWKNSNSNIYVHNLGGFDAAYLFNILHKEFGAEPIIKNSRIYQLEIKCSLGNKNRKITLKFKDSLLMLPVPLRDLCEIFKVNTIKGIFPYKFASLNRLNYIGEIPNYEFYDKKDISFEDWNSLKKENWHFKDETLKYLEKDLKSLYEILYKFNRIIFHNYSINMTKYLSLPSLSFAMYRTHYLKDHKIPIITGSIYNDLKDAYYGGVVDVYKPVIEKGYLYDVNSLYPYVMQLNKNKMPIGNIVYTTEKDLDKIFGCVYATIKTTKNLKIPPLPYKTVDGRLITPNGTWSGMYFSEELKQVKDLYGYEIQVHWGYQFEKGELVFHDFVNHFYEIKNDSKKLPELQFSAKLILNSLHGRLGMQEFKDATKVVSREKSEEIMKTRKVFTEYELDNDTFLINYETKPDKGLCLASGSNYMQLLIEESKNVHKSNISIIVSIAITAYARMYMNELKHFYDYEIYYSDTDSIVTNKPLPDNLVGKEIGKLKLEHEFYRGLFIAPKLYYIESIKKGVIIKSKGIKTELTKEQFEALYNMENLKFQEQRWIQDYKVGTIKVIDRSINIELKVLKRNRLISQGKWIDTSPLIINDKVESLSLYGIGTIINLDENLEIIYKDYSLKQITAPDYKLLAAPKDIEYLNILQKNEKEISELLNKLDELNKKIENLKIKINNQSDNLWINLYKTYLIEPERLKGEILRKLYILGVKDIDTINNFKNMIKLNTNKNIEIPNIIYLPAPSSPPVIIYIYSPIKLLALPAPNNKFLQAPNYKLLKAPEIIIDSNNGGGSNKIELPKIIYLSSPLIKASKKFNCNNAEIKKILQNEFNELNDTINNLFSELKAEKDFNTKDLLHAEYMKELYLYKIFVIKNWDLIQIPKNIIHFSQINKFSWESELNLTNRLIHMYKNGDYNKNITNIFISEMIEYSKSLDRVINNDKIDSIENISSIKNINSPIKRKFSTYINKEQRIQEIIDSIKDTENFQIAMTHKSCRNEDKNLKSYETFEFMGDKLLDKYISLFIFDSYPEYNEGDLTKLNNLLVSGKNLSAISKTIGLDKYLKLNKNLEEQIKQGKINDQKILGDIFESFITALYKEKGEKILFEFLSLTVLDRPELKDKLKTYNKNVKAHKSNDNKTNIVKFEPIKLIYDGNAHSYHTVLAFNSLILNIFNMAFIIFIIWLLFFFNNETSDIITNPILDQNFEIKKFMNPIINRIYKYIVLGILQGTGTYILIKNLFMSENISENISENNNSLIETDFEDIFSFFKDMLDNQIKIQENLEDMDNIVDKLKNENQEYLGILDQLSLENSRKEEMFSRFESETEKILAELGPDGPIYEEPINNVSDSKEKFSLTKNLIISASILGSSIVLSKIIPTLLEIFLK